MLDWQKQITMNLLTSSVAWRDEKKEKEGDVK